MTSSNDDTCEELSRALFGSVCHELGSPLSSLTANVTLAEELLTEAPHDGPGPRATAELADMLGDMRLAIGNLTALVADLRDLVGARPAEGPVSIVAAAATALRLARLPTSRARIVVTTAGLGETRVALERAAFVRAIAHAIIVVARASAPGSRIEIGPATSGTGVTLQVSPPLVDHDGLTRRFEAVARALTSAGGALSCGPSTVEATCLTLSGPRAEPLASEEAPSPAVNGGP